MPGGIVVYHFFSMRSALSPQIISDLEESLKVMKAQRKNVVVEPKQASGKRKFDFDKAARFFVDRLPTSKDMTVHMSCTKMCVYLNVKRPEFINAVRALGYDGEITLRSERRGRKKSLK